MAGARHIILLDGAVRRRATISHYLSGHGIHVEPYETVSEFGHHIPRGLILVHDLPDTIADLTERLVQAGSWLPVVAYAEKPEPRRIVDAILAGAIDYIAWPFDEDQLTTTLETAEDRAASIGHARLREAVARRRIERLTPREREVLSGMAGGHSNRSIAERLEISPRTVEIHRANMLTKIGATHTSDAIRIAIEAALVRDAAS